ncbi:MAG: hypothetical protein ACLGG0_13145 [Bacteriovoracia bacterium]
MPQWAKKFYRIWDNLSDSQAEALKLEWFYEDDEKPTQEESAKRLGISIASYQERLEWAYKKLEILYPEFTTRKRKNPTVTKMAQPPEPLYEILTCGDKVQIQHPVRQNKILTTRQRQKIMKWVHESTANYLFRYDHYTDFNDLEDENELEAFEEAIEQEHQDLLDLKAEESGPALLRLDKILSQTNDT